MSEIAQHCNILTLRYLQLRRNYITHMKTLTTQMVIRSLTEPSPSTMPQSHGLRNSPRCSISSSNHIQFCQSVANMQHASTAAYCRQSPVLQTPPHQHAMPRIFPEVYEVSLFHARTHHKLSRILGTGV
jgi:hypothetical protein